MKRIKAFTLAEVLIALGVIGVVSALTLPSLVVNHQKDVYVTSLKKISNELSQAAQRKMTDMNVDTFKDTGVPASIDAAKSISGLILEHFSEIQIGYYDFQLFIKKEAASENNFPIIAYKQHNSSEFSWTKNREKTEEEG